MMDSQILLVDDDTALLEALSEALRLRMDAAEIAVCDSASAALEQIASVDYDAIVADIKMPGMDGLELLSRIKELRPDTPTILITGHGEHDLAVQALRGGAQDYVQKPIDRDYFVASLKRAIECHKLSRAVREQRLALEHQARELEGCVQERTAELREFYHREQTAREQLTEALRKLEAAQRQRDEFVSMVAHDLGQPLTAMLGYAELLGRPSASAEVQQRAQRIILSEMRRISRLVEDLVATAGADAHRLAVQPVPCDLVEIAREQVELARVRSDRHEILLEAPCQQLAITCDRDRLAEVVSNLLTNAISHTEGGRICVRIGLAGREARLTVSDEGLGVPAEQAARIFEPRVRLSAGKDADSGGGAGLGLYIARQIVEAHGGRIWLESESGSGATFNVSLPMLPAVGSVVAAGG
jgi:two-component system, sensor histidine kinase and response regulator